jgi:hypothetical protein
MKLGAVIGLFLCVAVCTAQIIKTVKPGSKDFKAIVAAARAQYQTAAAFPIKTPKGPVRRAGNWAFLHERLHFVDPKKVGDGEGMALLKFTGGKWKVIEWNVGSGGMEDFAEEWTQRYKLPKGLAR